MDFGLDTLVYINIGIIFVVAQASRKSIITRVNPRAATPVGKEEKKEEFAAFWEEFLGSDLTANQVPVPVKIQTVPPVFAEPAVFQRDKTVLQETAIPKSSLKSPGERPGAVEQNPALLPDVDQPFLSFDLRSAVVYSVILERKYA